MEGIIVVNKPDGMTSHDVVDRVRHRFKMRRVGHAGTLDPLATGVLIILLGKATKLFSKFVDFQKAYRATLILGIQTDSADIQGKILQQKESSHIVQRDVELAFKGFVGEIEQVPPMVSAVKINGKKLYQLARKGITVERAAKKITIERLDLIDFRAPEVEFYLECSKGTYVRQLAEDVGNVLGCGACISQIQRTKVGSFKIEDAIDIEDLDESHIRHWEN